MATATLRVDQYHELDDDVRYLLDVWLFDEAVLTLRRDDHWYLVELNLGEGCVAIREEYCDPKGPWPDPPIDRRRVMPVRSMPPRRVLEVAFGWGAP